MSTPKNPLSQPAKPAFSLWPDWLRADPTVAPGLRESYRRTVEEFLQYCAGRAAAVTVAQAREFVALARLREAPSPARLREWQEGLNWFFRRAKEAGNAALQGVPSLARTDLGTASWEVAFIAYLRQRGRSWRTEQTYRGWLWRFVRWLGKRPIAEAGAAEVREFLSHLATHERVGVATQKQALNALVVFFRDVEGRELGMVGDFERAQRRVRVPVVLNRAECDRLFAALDGTPRLMAELMFGSGIRLMELLRLRIKDVDLERGQLIVRGGKGDADRVTVLPERLQEQLRAHRERLRRLHGEDRSAGLPGVWLPEALERKWPGAGAQWEWQWYWPSRELSLDPRSGLRRRIMCWTRRFSITSGKRRAGRSWTRR